MATAPSGKKGRGKNSVIHSPGDACAETAIGQQVIIATVAVMGDERINAHRPMPRRTQ
jgi:aspartate 1-decarboxylase